MSKIIERAEPTVGEIDDRVAANQSQMEDATLSQTLRDDADARLLADAILAAFVRNKPDVASRLGRFLMLRAMQMPAAREAAAKELRDEQDH